MPSFPPHLPTPPNGFPRTPPPSPGPGAQQIGDLVPEPGGWRSGPTAWRGGAGQGGPGKPETRPLAAAACAPAPRRQGAPGLPRWLRVQGGRKRLSSRRLIGLSGASCFLFHQGPANMVGSLGLKLFSPAIDLHPRLSAASNPVRPGPPRAAGSRVGPRAPAAPAAPALPPGRGPSPRPPAAGARRRAPSRRGSGSR